MEKLTEHEAYMAMYAFLEYLYDMTGSDELGSLLGSISLLPDGRPADAGLWPVWREAVSKARSGDVDVNLNLKPM